MSYILDALKKKETESNEAVPDIKSQHYHSDFEEEDKNHWKYIVILLAILTVLALLIVAYNYGKQVDSSDRVVEELESSLSQRTESEVKKSEQNEAVSIEQVDFEVTKDNENKIEVATKPIELHKPVVQKVVLPKPKPVSSATQKVSNDSKAEPSNVVNSQASEGDVNDSKNLAINDDLGALPAIRYTSHVYADEPKDRFVMLNGRALGIGQKLPNGVRVEDIYEDDLLVSYQGKTYQIPSLTDVNQ